MKFAVLLLALTPLLASAKLVTRTVDYTDAKGAALQGYVVYDDATKGRRPGIIVVHDWRGLTDYTQKRAEMLAQLGYVAFEADIYGKGVHPASVPEYAQAMTPYKADRNLYRMRVRAAYNEFLRQPEVDQIRIAAVGYCFGGTGVIEMVRDGVPVLGVVSFHGGLDAQPIPPDTTRSTQVLALCGADDPFEKPEDMKAFVAQMHEMGVRLKVIKYPGAVHAFTDAGVDALNLPGAKYNASADHKSWDAMKAFLRQLFS